ncbi:MAG TPA: tRNA (N6-isopentenyl adenosine(37)-C2)-methylthiotransferase MiaB [Bacteroidales bacterium]|nr:tRNA (N6-isopentenyl adenosine(37)-C2)-methylthiotransferase MiaB [Bacteroidales bacterium]
MNIESKKSVTFKPVGLAHESKVYIETYGCQMNVNDSEVVVSILGKNGYTLTGKAEEADLIFINTCSIRENAEQRVRGRLDHFRKVKSQYPDIKIGVIGCMAERLKEQLLDEEKMVDMVIGPDAYRDIPALLETVDNGEKAVNVILSRKETYADIMPVRLDKNGVTAFVSIMRGCNNMCAYCVVPYTRGGERSRDPESILNEVKDLFSKGYREVTLLGQNVNSFQWQHPDGHTTGFPELLDAVAAISPLLRVRFATSHPKDMTDEVLHVMARYSNICKSIHLPAQSGSSRMLEKMNRRYTREWYLERIQAIRTIIPDCAVSTDLIAGFCNETEEDHKQTLSLMKNATFDFAYMFKYSERPKTLAQRKYKDDVPEEVKTQRLNEIIALQQELSVQSKQQDIGNIFEVLVEGISKKSNEELFGRTSQNKVVVFPAEQYKAGDYVNVKIQDSTPATLLGEAVK